MLRVNYIWGNFKLIKLVLLASCLVLLIMSLTFISSFSVIKNIEPEYIKEKRLYRAGSTISKNNTLILDANTLDAYPDETPDGISALVFLIIGIGDFPQSGENPLSDIDVSDAILFREKARYYCLHTPIDYDKWKVISLIDNINDTNHISFSDFQYYINYVDRITQSDDRVIFYLATHGYVRKEEGYGIYMGDGSHVSYSTLAAMLNSIDSALDFYWAAHCYSADVINKMLNSGLNNDESLYLGYKSPLSSEAAYWATNSFWTHMLSNYDMTVEHWYFQYLRPHDNSWLLFDYYYGSSGSLVLGSPYPNR